MHQQYSGKAYERWVLVILLLSRSRGRRRRRRRRRLRRLNVSRQAPVFCVIN